MKTKKFAIVLAGSGVFDGSEIHESTLTMLSVAKSGGVYQCFAPDKEQAQVINHLTGEEMPEKRNVLVEAARIARGNIKPLSDFSPDDFDAILIPGGFGVAKNLCTFALDGPECSVDPEIEKIVKTAVVKSIPIGALCISPVLIARILPSVDVTIGEDQETAEAIGKMGGAHHITDHGEIIIDEKYKLVTTPCYMLDATIDQIAEGTDNIVHELNYMIDNA